MYITLSLSPPPDLRAPGKGGQFQVGIYLKCLVLGSSHVAAILTQHADVIKWLLETRGTI